MLKLNREISLDDFTERIDGLYYRIKRKFETDYRVRLTPYCTFISDDCTLCRRIFWWYKELLTGNENNIKKFENSACPALEIFDFEGLYKAVLKAIAMERTNFEFISSSFYSVFCVCNLQSTITDISKKINEENENEIENEDIENLYMEILLKILSYFKEKEKKEKEEL